MIYPCKDPKRNKQYDTFLKKANDLWDLFTTGKTGGVKKLREISEAKK